MGGKKAGGNREKNEEINENKNGEEMQPSPAGGSGFFCVAWPGPPRGTVPHEHLGGPAPGAILPIRNTDHSIVWGRTLWIVGGSGGMKGFDDDSR